MPNYNRTIRACFVASSVQSVVINFAPLLYLTFHNSYNIPLAKITLLVTVNFLLQLVVDAASIGFVDRLGYRAGIVLAHAFSAAGLILMALLPDVTPDPYTGLLIATVVYSIGSGLLEVLTSPIMEACPTKSKDRAMSLMHSFFCWGHMVVVLVSTLFFVIFGVENWKILTLIWALVPLLNMINFARVPIAPLLKEGETGLSVLELAKNKLFWLMLLVMVCGGASEQSVSQWASALAESGLGVSKTLGDLMGPMFFACTMGIARVFYSKAEGKISLERFMMGCGLLCIFAYLLVALSPWPVVGLIGCGICGFSVGIFWPGTLSLASATLPRGGTMMFCLLALAGDLGCSAGPTLAGMVSSANGDNLQLGILFAAIFPAVLICGLLVQRRMVKKGA
ncbi:MAG: MFS transporter [Clostridia bacterium]|nr:MFS transporter [Clostridia bacterium]